jgi:hypothetical protein
MWMFDDGGRAAAGFKGETRDCVVRSAAIVTGRAYREVYELVSELAKSERVGQRKGRVSSPRLGVYRATTRRLMEALGLVWTPTMSVGSGCKVHLRADELPRGRLVVKCSRHVTAVIDGVVHDTEDPSREGNRCVYGLWTAT